MSPTHEELRGRMADALAGTIDGSAMYVLGYAAGAAAVRKLLEACGVCEMPRDHAWHQPIAECSKALGRPCDHPSEHHPFA